jgi:hypothetical protein
MKLFLDEAGHTGKHLFDPAQPVLIYAGVWLDEETESLCRAAIEKAFGGSAERKGSRLLRSSPGRRLVHDCLEPCVDRAAPVSVFVFNKPFQAAAVVVEDCTDYVDNPAFDQRWLSDFETKAQLAQRILNASHPAQLMEVWRLRLGPKEEFISAYERLLHSLELSRDGTLSALARKMLHANFAAIWEVEQTTNAADWTYSPNLNAFVSLVQSANRQARYLSFNDVSVVHDEQVEFQSKFANAFELFRNAQPGRQVLPNGNVSETPIDRLTSLSFASSDSEVGLQLADLVASCVRMFASGASQSGPLRDVARWVMSGGDEIFPIVFGSPEWQIRTFQHLHDAAR